MIGVAVNTDVAYGRNVLRGVADYVEKQARSRWDDMLCLPWPLLDRQLRKVRRFDGLIMQVRTQQQAVVLETCGIPAVNVSDSRMNSRLPTVVTDDKAVGSAAARFFLDRGYRHFAYLAGDGGTDYSDLRGRGFVEAVGAANRTVSWFGRCRGRLPKGARRFRGTPVAWATALPKPVALFAPNDALAATFRKVADAAGLVVPHQISIVGTDDDPLFHDGTAGISSIALPARQIGFAAAELLERLLAGERLPGYRQYLPPGALAPRSSSDCRAIDDADVLEAMAHIRRHEGHGVTVDDLLDVVPLSRRTLERRFAAVLGTSPLREIRRARIGHACRLLKTTHLSVREIASAVGCRDRSHLTVDMKALTGMSPRAYRAHHARSASRGGQ